jgi:hypothetical protein
MDVSLVVNCRREKLSEKQSVAFFFFLKAGSMEVTSSWDRPLQCIELGSIHLMHAVGLGAHIADPLNTSQAVFR